MSKHVPSWDSVNIPSNVDERIALIQEFHSYLVERGYANRTLHLYCSVAAHFLRWQHEAGSTRQRIDAPSVSRFLLKHVPACRCPHPGSMDFKSMPLPQLTGGALADYLRHGRPVIPTRAVFVLHRAPVGQAATNTTVRGAIRRAFVRAGLPWSGTHILRHTAAARMVQGGVPLKEVADVLGHRNIDTTLIYTKVNLSQLARVALPWPRRQP